MLFSCISSLIHCKDTDVFSISKEKVEKLTGGYLGGGCEGVGGRVGGGWGRVGGGWGRVGGGWGRVCNGFGHSLFLSYRPCPPEWARSRMDALLNGHGLRLKIKPCPKAQTTMPKILADHAQNQLAGGIVASAISVFK